jgi:hypothetical protein
VTRQGPIHDRFETNQIPNGVALGHKQCDTRPAGLKLLAREHFDTAGRVGSYDSVAGHAQQKRKVILGSVKMDQDRSIQAGYSR